MIRSSCWLYEKAAEQGWVAAPYRLGRWLLKGEGVGQDEEQAFKWIHKAAEAGYRGAKNVLGVMYAQGKGVAADHDEAAGARA